MSKLEFVAIQFGVKFTIMYNVRRYVEKVCQRYLHFSIYFENFVTLHNYFMILFYFNLIFLLSRSFYIIPYMDLRPWEAISVWEKICCIFIG